MSALAMLFARYIMSGDKLYADVPKVLKPQVAQILRENELEHLIVE